MTDEVQPQSPLDDAREKLIASCEKPKTTRELVAAFEDFIRECIKEAIARIVVEQGNTGIAGKAPWE